MNNNRHQRIIWKLVQDQHGYPPVSEEALWAERIGPREFRVDNIPFYAPLVSVDDIIDADLVVNEWVFRSVMKLGGHSTVRVISYGAGLVTTVRKELAVLGCRTELSNVPTLFAVDIPPSVDYALVISLLERYVAAGSLDYEESSIQHQ